MEQLFFNKSGSFDEVAGAVFRALGLLSGEGDSANALGGDYHVASALGVDVRLERNSYDYEDEYEYMLSIRKNLASPLNVAPSVSEYVARAAARMLADNVGLSVAREGEGGLELLTA